MITVRTGATALKQVAAPLPGSATEVPPDPFAVRAACPMCDRPVVSEMQFRSGTGYLIVAECAGMRAEPPLCDYRRVL